MLGGTWAGLAACGRMMIANCTYIVQVKDYILFRTGVWINNSASLPRDETESAETTLWMNSR